MIKNVKIKSLTLTKRNLKQNINNVLPNINNLLPNINNVPQLFNVYILNKKFDL